MGGRTIASVAHQRHVRAQRTARVDSGTDGPEVSFLGRLESTDSLSVPSWAEIPDATNSPYRVEAPRSQQFFRSTGQ